MPADVSCGTPISYKRLYELNDLFSLITVLTAEVTIKKKNGQTNNNNLTNLFDVNCSLYGNIHN